jgi:hypothetical protein
MFKDENGRKRKTFKIIYRVEITDSYLPSTKFQEAVYDL